MSTPWRLAAVVAAVLAWASPAAAQFGPQQLGDAPLLEELIVTASDGPPWWTVKKGASTVYVFVTPGLIPADLSFSQRRLERRVAGARELILPPNVAFDISAVLVLPALGKLMKGMNGGQRTDLEPTLPPDVRRRFVAQRERIGQPEVHYGSLGPGLAGIALAGDAALFARRNAGVASGRAIDQIAVDLAKKSRVKVRRAKTYGGPTMAAFMSELSRPGLPCLVSVLDDLERPPRPASAAAQARAVKAWAEGDVRPLLVRARSSDARADAQVNFNTKGRQLALRINTPQCWEPLVTGRRVSAEWVPSYTAAIEEALRKKGSAVVIVDAGTLLVKDGVLDRLQKRGYDVTAPNAD